ncbi:hypothetical protein [Streptomyces sp. NPDC047061]|uniref:hypothetical protein n=1 Tax=Streptomyces sp. NPDC047061 TaxID=3154605 RepID=UPI003401542D
MLKFLTSPVQVIGTERVDGLLVTRNQVERGPGGRLVPQPTGAESVIKTGLVLRAVGYFGQPLAGLPFDSLRGVVPHRDGRIHDGDVPRYGWYVTGWVKRGPRGMIGTNKKCARDTVRTLLADSEAGLLPTAETLTASEADRALRARCPDLVDGTGWLRLDDHERRAGRAAGRPRRKIVDRRGQIRIANDAPRIQEPSQG